MTEVPARTRYRPELDGIRTLAIAGVLLFHAAPLLPFRLSGGALGVDLFFVLSGALITSLLVHEHDRTGSIDLSSFYARRILRLIPALVVLLLVCVAIAPLLTEKTRAPPAYVLRRSCATVSLRSRAS